MNLLTERWNGIYIRRGKTVELIAILKPNGSTLHWDVDREQLFHVGLYIRLVPYPITVFETPINNIGGKAVELLDAIVNGDDRELGKAIEDAKALLSGIFGAAPA